MPPNRELKRLKLNLEPPNAKLWAMAEKLKVAVLGVGSLGK